MLKKICKLLVLGMVVYTGSACVTPTHASSAQDILITHVYPGTQAGAVHELVALYNNTADPIDITGWCLTNKDSKNIFCFNGGGSQYLIEPYSRVVLASTAYAALNAEYNLDVVYEPLNKSSGSLVGSSDNMQLKNSQAELVTSWSWSTALVKGDGFIRSGYSQEEFLYNEDSALQTGLIEPVDGGGLRIEKQDPPADPTDKLILNEILPNPTGVDKDNEFIEIFNQSDEELNLDNIAIQIIGGTSYKIFSLSGMGVILPNEYVVLNDASLGFSLNNTAGSVYLLYTPTGNEADYTKVDGVSYEKPADGMSYSWFAEFDEWQYTTPPTPNLVNSVAVSTSMLLVTPKPPTPCNPDQERNPDTGRCRKIPVLSVPTPCKTGQYRSPETGRCRNVATAVTPTPCKEGQERNLETNRCRNIKKMTVATNSVVPTDTKVESGIKWYAWVMVGLIILAVAGYGLWEWRFEVAMLWKKVFGVKAR